MDDIVFTLKTKSGFLNRYRVLRERISYAPGKIILDKKEIKIENHRHLINVRTKIETGAIQINVPMLFPNMHSDEEVFKRLKARGINSMWFHIVYSEAKFNCQISKKLFTSTELYKQTVNIDEVLQWGKIPIIKSNPLELLTSVAPVPILATIVGATHLQYFKFLLSNGQNS